MDDDGNRRLRADAAAQFLSERLGIKIETKTLSNWRASGRRGPKPEYFGLVPVYRVAELRRWVDEEAFCDRPSRSRRGACPSQMTAA